MLGCRGRWAGALPALSGVQQLAAETTQLPLLKSSLFKLNDKRVEVLCQHRRRDGAGLVRGQLPREVYISWAGTRMSRGLC